ncbi:type 1 glutamine amidotransferase [Polycladidibacter stylochi]|uniref:type 1 glutamine amidotransferase n=1 Tax=Polycladidibacter stylochi TaxID=1807766 RepID=UPI000830A3A4|nr:type 1 glutamine amidotransferase [Pseudovibrio stylochi]
MHILIIENCQNVTLGIVETALQEVKARQSYLKPYMGQELPNSPESFDALIVLGGLQNARSDAEHPYLSNLCSLITQFHAKDLPVLGICLGAQLMARAFGAQSILDQPVEAGWLPLSPTMEAATDPVLSCLKEGDHLFVFHTDTYSLPEGAVRLVSTPQTPNHAFRIGKACYAIQFHFECGIDEVKNWTSCFHSEFTVLLPNWQQIIGEQAKKHGEKAERLGLEIARNWLKLVASKNS